MEGGQRILAGGQRGRAVRLVERCLAALGTALYPHACLACGVEGPVLCVDHHDIARRSLGGVVSCPRCGTDTPDGASCGAAACTTPLDGLLSMGAYARSPAGALLRQWKYEGVDEARTFLLGAVRTHVSDMRERYAAFVEGAVLVPAPCDPIRRATRGFDQSVMLAREVSRALGGPRVVPLLARSVRFKAQASLDGHDARRQNARDAFLIKKGIVVPDRVVLIDDVATSGATLEACAVVLKKAGVYRVRALTIMRG